VVVNFSFEIQGFVGRAMCIADKKQVDFQGGYSLRLGVPAID